MPTDTDDLTVSVVICAYTERRWELLCDAVDSVMHQTRPPIELLLSIDHNPDLYAKCSERWHDPLGTRGEIPVTVVENSGSGRLGSARTTACKLAKGDIVAFLDDDASAEPKWLEMLIRPYDSPDVVAVGGSAQARYEIKRPRWFPEQCNWVFGCTYEGLPTSLSPVRHVIGANMSCRRRDLETVGYFHSDNHDDMDMSHRLADLAPTNLVMFEPAAVVRHFVSRDRLTWRYFWRRCFFVNRGKVEAFKEMGAAGNLTAERQFTQRALTQGLARAVRETADGDPSGLVRYLALVTSIGLAGAGYLAGSAEWRWRCRGGRGG